MFESSSTSPASSEYNESVESLAARRHFEHAAALQKNSARCSRDARDYYAAGISDAIVAFKQLEAWAAATAARQAYDLACDVNRSAY